MDVCILYRGLEFLGIYTPARRFCLATDTPPTFPCFELEKVFKDGEEVTEEFNYYQNLFDADPADLENRLINEYENYIL